MAVGRIRKGDQTMIKRLQEITFALALFTSITAFTAFIVIEEPRSKEGVCFGIIFLINLVIALFVMNKIDS
jgi:hypothetical protein